MFRRFAAVRKRRVREQKAKAEEEGGVESKEKEYVQPVRGIIAFDV